MEDSFVTEVETGLIFKVIFNDLHTGTVTAQLPNGNTSIINDLNSDILKRGDVIFIDNANKWKIMPKDVWISSNTIGIVKKILKDGRILVDSNYTLKTTVNLQELDLIIGSTIEYNEIDGIQAIISEKPIKSNGLQSEAEDTSGDYLYEKSAEGYTFENFGGYPEVISRARELIQNQLENRPFLDAMNVRPIRGILLTGPPGTGKTFLARIIAQESNAKFFLVNGPTIVSKWLGESENTLRQIFDAAKQSENGAIIFFDEIDSIAADRSGDTHEASKKLVAQLLTLMDGFNENDGNVVVIAATNRADALDPAIRRPGRFDWEIKFGNPTIEDRYQILLKSVARHKTATNLPIIEIVELTDGWSAAELGLIIVEAGQIAAADKRYEIAAEDFAQGFEMVSSQLQKILDRERLNGLA